MTPYLQVRIKGYVTATKQQPTNRFNTNIHLYESLGFCGALDRKALREKENEKPTSKAVIHLKPNLASAFLFGDFNRKQRRLGYFCN